MSVMFSDHSTVSNTNIQRLPVAAPATYPYRGRNDDTEKRDPLEGVEFFPAPVQAKFRQAKAAPRSATLPPRYPRQHSIDTSYRTDTGKHVPVDPLNLKTIGGSSGNINQSSLATSNLGLSNTSASHKLSKSSLNYNTTSQSYNNIPPHQRSYNSLTDEPLKTRSRYNYRYYRNKR